jgi:integrase
MPKKPKYEAIRCNHFLWRLSRRDKVWYADGRTNTINVGRHSLGTRDKAEALSLLVRLDESRAVKFGLIERKASISAAPSELTLAEGRQLYEAHISRSRVAGGVKDSTKKRYRAVFDKFVPWAGKHGIVYFNQVDAGVLNRYATTLEKQCYAQKTLLNELTTLKQCVRWLIDDGRLVGCEPINLKLKKVESQRAYCYRSTEVVAILERCRQVPTLGWIGDAVTALAHTGMRIQELANLRWSDVDFENNRVTLTDESGRAASDEPRRTLKSGRSRSFPVHPDLLVVLKRLPKIDQYVFHGPHGGRLKADFVRRMFVRQVLQPLADKFPAASGGQSFIDGRMHGFRHFFVSLCATSGVPERVVMEWVGHADSSMVRHYFFLHDDEAKRYMNGLNVFEKTAGCSDGQIPKS